MIATTLKDGFGIRLTFSGHEADIPLIVDPTSITPPGIDGGDPIDATTHSNTAVRTKRPRQLVEITDASMTVVYDPDAWDDIRALIGVNTEITITFPTPGDGTLTVWGYLKSFTPNAYVEGEQATAEAVVVITNANAAQAETGPAYVA